MAGFKPALLAGTMALALSGTACSQAPEAVAKPITLQSVGALSFDDANTLFVGDSKAGMVHAFTFPEASFDDQATYRLGRAQTFEGRTIFDNLDAKVAALLGTTSADISINDMVAHKPSKQVFLSIHRGHGPEATPVLVKVDKGALELVDLDQATHTAQSVGSVPTVETLEFGQPLYNLAITDIDFYDGELFVAGVSNEEFSSKLRRMSFPFDNEVATSSIEIWHAVHAQYETRAPIITQTISELDGEPTLIAIYACTPIVRIPLSELENGAKVKSEMIGEMGFGNTPIDIIEYVNGWDQTKNVLVTNTNRSAVQIPLSSIASAQTMPEGEGAQPVFSVAGVDQYSMPMSGTLHLDTVDENWAIAVRRSPEDTRNIQLHTIPLPFFFDRADHVVEMNWADGPDPFGYKAAPPISYD
ncbi:MAG: hypothetical protein ABNH53_03410 [Henriciella sp.]